MKCNLNFKLDCILTYKEGRRDFVPVCISRDNFLAHVRPLVKIFDDFGINGLKHSSFSKEWTAEERLVLVSKFLMAILLKILILMMGNFRIASDNGDFSGSLYDFYCNISKKITSDLKTPFIIKDNVSYQLVIDLCNSLP